MTGSKKVSAARQRPGPISRSRTPTSPRSADRRVFAELTKPRNELSYVVGAGARLTLHLLDVANVNARTEVTIELRERAEATVVLSSFARKKTAKNHLIRFLHASDFASSSFSGYVVGAQLSQTKVKIVSDIKPKTTGNRTDQQIKGVLLADDAQIHGEPQLIIDDNNVKAKHALAIGRINPNQVFYLMARGISRAAAIRLILWGYFNATLEAIEDETRRDECRARIQRLFTGV